MTDLPQTNSSSFEGECAAPPQENPGERRSRDLADAVELTDPPVDDGPDPLLDPDEPGDLIVNIQEAAKICGVSYETIRRAVMLDDTFPPFRAGKSGKGYEMSASRVRAWFLARQAAEERAKEQRAEALEQFGLGLPKTDEDKELENFKPAELKQIYEARRIANQVAQASGQLLEVGQVRGVLEEVFEMIRRAVQEELPDELATRYSFDREQRVDLEERCALILRRAAERLTTIGEEPPAAAGGMM